MFARERCFSYFIYLLIVSRVLKRFPETSLRRRQRLTNLLSKLFFERALIFTGLLMSGKGSQIGACSARVFIHKEPLHGTFYERLLMLCPIGLALRARLRR